LQDKLSSSRVNPSTPDMQKIKQHPASSVTFLKNQGLTNEHWLQSVGQHHEEPDRKGYPNKLSSGHTYVGAQILRACDRFVARTASRRYRTGMLTRDPMKTVETVIPNDHGILAALASDMGPTH
jgi:HD-GYP domain-containing protein (c-di-GMP phosphodiesterase class II)